VKTLPIGTLRVWAIEFSIPPNGPRNVKSFLHPFIERFITAIHTVESYSALDLSSLLALTCSSVPVLQYHYLLQKYIRYTPFILFPLPFFVLLTTLFIRSVSPLELISIRFVPALPCSFACLFFPIQ
jgi:hypothetical protein